ncbi:tetratricopeptide repeat protein [Candidatus Bipolaricaulota bacterium]|nr:tetratricopeptide repeat protein [Candidatus Bipolaricaulota bacterium]
MSKRKDKKRIPPPSRPAARWSRFRFWALVAFLLTMPLFFSPWNTEYGYTKAIYTLVFVSFLLLLWAVEVLPRREAKVELSWLFPVLPALLFASFLSLSGRTPAPVVLQSATLILYFGFIFLLVVNAPLGDREIVLLLGALLVGGVGNALFGLLQHLGVAPGAAEDPMIATMGNRQFLAGFLSYLVLPAGILLVRLRRPWTWVPALAGAGFVLAVMLLTRQVGVRLGLGAGLAFVAFGIGFWPTKGGSWPRWGAAVAVAVAALGGVLGVQGLVYAAVLALALAAVAGLAWLLRRIPLLWIAAGALLLAAVVLLLPVTTPLAGVRQLWERQSGAVRAWDLWVGYEMWRDRPLFGVGLGGYKIHFVPYKPSFLASPRGAYYAFPFPRADQAHNEYVQVAAELGTVGALVVLVGVGTLGYLGLRRVSSQRDPVKRLELLLLGGGLVAVLVHAVPTFPFHLPASSLVFVVLLGLSLSPRYGPVGDLRVSLRGRGLRLVALVLPLFAAAVSVIAVRDMIADGYLLAGRVSLGFGDVALARQQLARAVELDFYPRVSLYWLGAAHAEAGDFPAARAAFRACLDRYVPENLYLQLASVDLKLGEIGEVRALLAELLATFPPRTMERDARYLLAIADLHDGDLLAAQRRLEEVLALDRNHEWAHFQLGEIARLRYLWEEARTHYERALAVVAAKEKKLQAAYGTAVSLARLGELRAEEAGLRELRGQIEWILGQIP